MKKIFLSLTACLLVGIMFTSCEKNNTSVNSIVGKWAVEEEGTGDTHWWWCIEFKSNGTYDSYEYQSNAYIENGYLVGGDDWTINDAGSYQYNSSTSTLTIVGSFSSKINWVSADEMYVIADDWHCYRVKGFK